MKELNEITAELKGIKTILSVIWHSKYNTAETDQVSPEFFASEYISIEECARRLSVTEQTIRNWILQGKKGNSYGWVQGVHYISIPSGPQKRVVRIPWNKLILTFSKGDPVTLRTFDSQSGEDLYKGSKKRNIDHVPDPSIPDVRE